MVLPLTFATFYICGIKGFTGLHQRVCVNLLLKGKYPDRSQFDLLSDSVCTNYVKGKKSLNSEIQIELFKLSREDIIDRLYKLGVQDITSAAGSLKNLVENSALSDNEKSELSKCYNTENEIIYIAAVFQKCVRGNNNQVITPAQMKLLEKCRQYSVVPGHKTGIVSESEDLGASGSIGPNSCVSKENGEKAEDIGWMTSYVSDSMSDSPIIFPDRVKVFHCDKIELPSDYRAMVYALKPVLTEENLKSFTLRDFFEAMEIDDLHHVIERGEIEYWQFEGAFEPILLMLRRIDFTDVSNFAVQLIGQFTLEQSEKLMRTLKKCSDDNADILDALIYDKELSHLKLILFIHRYVLDDEQ